MDNKEIQRQKSVQVVVVQLTTPHFDSVVMAIRRSWHARSCRMVRMVHIPRHLSSKHAFSAIFLLFIHSSTNTNLLSGLQSLLGLFEVDNLPNSLKVLWLSACTSVVRVCK